MLFAGDLVSLQAGVLLCMREVELLFNHEKKDSDGEITWY